MFSTRSISTPAARRIRKTPFNRTEEVCESKSLPDFEDLTPSNRCCPKMAHPRPPRALTEEIVVGVERVYKRSRQIGLVNAPSPATSHTANRAHVHPALPSGVSTSQLYS